VQFGHRSLIGIGVEMDDDPDRGESRVPIGEAEEAVHGATATGIDGVSPQNAAPTALRVRTGGRWSATPAP